VIELRARRLVENIIGSWLILVPMVVGGNEGGARVEHERERERGSDRVVVVCSLLELVVPPQSWLEFCAPSGAIIAKPSQ